MAVGFKIAEGYIEIETRFDGDKVVRQAVKVGERAGTAAGKRTSHTFRESFKKDVDRDRNFMPDVFRTMFRHNPRAMRTLLHPLEATFARPIAGLLGVALVPALVGALSGALSSAVLLGIGAAVPAAGIAILLGNEKIQKKVSQQNLTRVRKDASIELGQLRANLRARLADMKAAGASEAAIRKVREQGNQEIAHKALEWQNKITDAAKNSSQSVTEMFKKTGLTVMKALTEAAQPLVGPLRLALENIGEMFSDPKNGLLPILKEMFTQGARLIPYFVDIFSTFAFRILPAINDIFPQVVKMFDILANRAPELADAVVDLLVAMSNENTLKSFNYFLTGLVGLMEALAFILVRSQDEFHSTIKLIETFVNFFLKAPGYIVDAWQNLVGWFHTALRKITEFFRNWKKDVSEEGTAILRFFTRWKDKIGNAIKNAIDAVTGAVSDAFDAVVDFFRKLPGRILGFLKALPKMLLGIIVASLEAMVYTVGFGLGKIVQFFAELPGKIVRFFQRLWKDMVDLTVKGLAQIVRFFKELPGKLQHESKRAMDDTKETISKGLTAVVDFFKKLPGRVVGALASLRDTLVGLWNSAWAATTRTVIERGLAVISWIRNTPQRLITALVKLLPTLVRIFRNAWDSAFATTKSWLKTIVTFVTNLPNRIFTALAKLRDRLVNKFAEGWSAATGASKQKVVDMINFVLGIPGRILTALRRLPGLLLESGRQLIQGLLQGILNRIKEIGGLGSWMKTNLVDPVVRAVKNFFGIHSPSTVFSGIGMNLVAGLWKGLASHNPIKMIGKIFGGMPQALGKLLEKGMVSVANLPSKALKALGSLWGAIGDLFGGGGKSKGTGGTIGLAANAWKLLQSVFGLPMGGYRAHGSVPGSDHPKGKAIDVMTSNPALHKAIIAFARNLPGLKYWISMRQIATAASGWKARPYNGPSPHTDHVHLSFFDKGGRLPEDIFGMGRSGRGYVMHKDETVVPKGNTIGHQGNVVHQHFGPGSVVIEARTIKEFNDVISMLSSIKPAARVGRRISHQAA